MKLDAAKSLVADALGRMGARYGATVFDEWVVVSLSAGRSGILAYSGPRAESFQRRFAADVAPLRGEMAGKQLAIGDFEFAPDATGTHFDACLRLGAASYLICNHTTKSMTQVRQSPNWLAAQKPFLELSEKIRVDPLE
jgi:hypothetical protein